MGESNHKRSRYRDTNRDSSDTDTKHPKRRPTTTPHTTARIETITDEQLILYRILCPDSIIGSVIGKGGKVINALRQETHAKIKIVDRYPSADKRVILVYCYVRDKTPVDEDEYLDDERDPLCYAQDALMRVHETIVDALRGDEEDGDEGRREEVELLVPASQASNVIGKSGSIIKRLRGSTRAGIRVNPKDAGNAKHSVAMGFDNFLQITGDPGAVKKALFAVSAIMYKFPPKEEISLDTTVSGSELPPTIIIPSDAPIYSAGSFYPSADALNAAYGAMPQVMGTTPHASELHGYTDSSSAWPMYPSALPVVSGYGGPSRSEELVVRVLCPSDKIGRVIGKGGSAIKSIRQESRARVEVDDTKKKGEECIITVTSTESTNDDKSAAVEAVLLLQNKISDEDEENVNFRLLVPNKVIGYLIGKNGSVVNDMRKRTKTDIRISKGEKPKCASSSDELVEVHGEVGNLRDALIQIVLRLREDVLRDREGTGSHSARADSLYTLSGPPALPTVAPATSMGYDQRTETGSGLGMLTSSSLYGYSSLQAGDNGYGAHSSYSSKGYGGLPSFIEMLIPSHALSKVVGKGGANLDNIRKISGADIEIVDSKTSRFERIAQISGTSEQKRAAENLIQAFIMAI